MIAQYAIVGLLVLIAAVYTVYKFSRVLKGKDSDCSSCPGCDLQNLKSDAKKNGCTGPENSDPDTKE